MRISMHVGSFIKSEIEMYHLLNKRVALTLSLLAPLTSIKTWTPLHDAAFTGGKASLAYVQKLINAGANIDEKDIYHQRTPLYIAVAYGNVAIIQLLLKNGAAIDAQDNCGWTPLFKAALKPDSTILQLLLAHDANVHHQCQPIGLTALKVAVTHRRAAITQWLIAYGATLDDPSIEGYDWYLAQRAAVFDGNALKPEWLAAKTNNNLKKHIT